MSAASDDDATDDPTRGVPPALLERLAALAPDGRAATLVAALVAPRDLALRVNTLRTDGPALDAELTAAGLAPRPVPGLPDARLLDRARRAELLALPAWHEGRLHVQDLASQAVPLALLPTAAERVLDLCAAPGSKTSQLAALRGGGAGLHANDRSRTRVFKLRAVLERLGVEGATVSQRPGESFGRSHAGAFDAVLLDAPCSMEGRLGGADGDWSAWSVGRSRRLAGQQRALLSAACQCLAPGGRLVYATCTLSPEENELVLHKWLRRHGERFALEPLELPLPSAVPGLTRWRERDLHPDLVRARRVLPGPLTEGFFVARLRRLA